MRGEKEGQTGIKTRKVREEWEAELKVEGRGEKERSGNRAKQELEKPYVHVARSLLTSPPRDLLANAAP